MTLHMNLTDAKARLSQVVDEVHSTHEEVEITRNGKPVAVIIAFDRLESIRETMEILGDPETMAALREDDAARAAGDDTYYTTPAKEELLAEIHAAAERNRAKAVGE